MAITQAVCNSWKGDILSGLHQPADVYKIALYTSAATLDKTTTVYTTSNEVVGTGYSAGGATLGTLTIAQTGDTWYWSWPDPTWPASTITARGALVYNSTRANAAVCVLDFGANITSTAGTFTVDLPAAGATALLRVT